MENLRYDAKALLESHGKAKTYAHCEVVADTCVALAQRFGLEREKAFRMGILHDVSAYVAPAAMMAYARAHEWEIDEAEKRYPFLLHGRMSAVIVKEKFGVSDTMALDAIACHSTLRATASPYDMLLFLADKISWDQAGEPPFLTKLLEALDCSLERASLYYIEYVLSHGMILYPHRWLLEAREYLRLNS